MPNYWILQANPGKYFIVDYFLDDWLKWHTRHREGTKEEYEEPWEVNKKHIEEFQQGDIVFVWKALKRPTKMGAPEYHEWKRLRKALGYWWPRERGIYALGKVTAPAAEIAFIVPGDRKKYYADPTWEKEEKPTYRVLFNYTCNLVDRPLLEREIPWSKLPYMAKAFVARQGRGISSYKLEPGEGELLLNMVCGTTGP